MVTGPWFCLAATYSAAATTKSAKVPLRHRLPTFSQEGVDVKLGLVAELDLQWRPCCPQEPRRSQCRLAWSCPEQQREERRKKNYTRHALRRRTRWTPSGSRRWSWGASKYLREDEVPPALDIVARRSLFLCALLVLRRRVINLSRYWKNVLTFKHRAWRPLYALRTLRRRVTLIRFPTRVKGRRVVHPPRRPMSPSGTAL